MKKLKTLFITCGGTGGHFYPGLTVAREFQNKGGQVLLLLSGVNAKRQAEIANAAGIEAKTLPMMPHPFRNPFKFISGALGGTSISRRLIKSENPDALLSMGSFASTPAVFAAKLTGTPLFLHDGNARIGKANRIFSRLARILAVGYPAVNGDKAKCPVIETGMPVRQTLINHKRISKSEAIIELNAKFSANLSSGLITFLIFGGSQGAAVFNEYFPEAFCKIAQEPGCPKFQVLHLAGKGKAEQIKCYQNAPFPHILLESSEDMHLFLAAADVAACRSGGSSLAELAIYGLPSVLIPYPYAAEGHQTDNARHFSAKDAAILIDNADLNASKAEEIIRYFLQTPENLRSMADKMRSLAKPDAAADLLAIIDKNI